MPISIKFVLAIIAIVVFSNCNKSLEWDLERSDLPMVSTDSTWSITMDSAVASGNITEYYGSIITEHGHCWSNSANPTINDSKTNLGANNSTGSYSSNLTGLSANTTYYVRAYATNSYGTSYGNDVVFITLTNNPPTIPIANFSTVNTEILIGESVSFTDLSQNLPTSWNWLATGSVIPNSTMQNPTFQYNSIGTFDVELTVSNTMGSDIEIKNGYIQVKDCEYFTNGINSWTSNGWSTSSSPNTYDGNSLFCWGANTSTPFTFTLSKSFQNIPNNSNVSFWYRIYSPGGNIKLKMNNTTIWTGQSSPSGWINEVVSISQGGNFTLEFESTLTGTATVYLDNICIGG